jgi:hypothetical protein
MPIEIYDSGPVLVANSVNRDSAAYEVPGEGKILRTTEEGSRVWKHKTRRTYHEDVKKEKQSSDHNKNNGNSVPAVTSSRSKKTHLGDTHYYGRTDDDKVVSTIVSSDHYARKTPTARTPSPSPARMQRYNFGDTSHLSRQSSTERKSLLLPVTSSPVASHVIRMEDKSVQCNLKKEKKKSFEIAQDFKVIKSNPRDGSVSAFSDVSLLHDPAKKEEKILYTTVETITPNETVVTQEMHEVKRERDYSYERSPNRHRDRSIEVTRTSRPPSSAYSPTPSRTRVITKSYGINAALEGAPDVTPRQSPLPRTTPRPLSNSWYYDSPGPLDIGSSARLESPSRSRNLQHETIEETISISNSSGDEMVENHKNVHSRVVRSALEQQEKELSDINGNYLSERMRLKSPLRVHDDIDSRLSRPTGGDFTMQRKSRETNPYQALDAQLARSSSNLDSMNGSPPGMWFKTPDSDYRKNLSKNQDIKANEIGIKPADHDHFCSATIARSNRRTTPIIDSNATIQSYTLDRKHLNERRKKAMSTFGVGHDPLSTTPSPLYRKAPSLPEKHRYTSDPFPVPLGMRRYNSTRDVSGPNSEYRRGGLAAAFRDRQERASSLNRSIERGFHGSDYNLSTRYDMRPTPRPGSRYDSEPEVHYVPVKQDQASYVGRSQSILSPKRNEKYSPKPKMTPGVHWAVTSKEYSQNPEGRDSSMTASPEGKQTKMSKKDLKRSQSIPKDTKYPWLSRLKFRVKAREP